MKSMLLYTEQICNLGRNSNFIIAIILVKQIISEHANKKQLY